MLLMAVLLASPGAMGVQVPVSIPSFVVEEAAKPQPIAFCLALLRVRIPCGMEIREEDYRWGFRPDHDRPLGEAGPLAEAVKVFEQRHPNYRVAVDSTAVVIRPRFQSLPFLDSVSPVREEKTVTGPLKSVKTVFAGLYPRLAGGGVELNSMGYPGWDRKVVLKGGQDRTATDTLNQIAVQLPGYAWLVTTKAVEGRVQVVELSVLESNGNRRYITISENR